MEDKLNQLRGDISNRLCHDIAPILDEEFDAALWNDDALFNWFMLAKRDTFIDYIAEAVSLDRTIVEKLIVRDTLAWKNAVVNGEARRWDSLREKISARFAVYEKNLNVMRQLSSLCEDKTGYLDVGCGLGFTMMAARELGFQKAHGVEVDQAFANTGLSLIDAGTEGNVGYVFGDFMTENLNPPYSLITFFDVLEHVVDIDQSIDRACNMTPEKGTIFFYQGNSRAIPIVLSEPHYRIPFLTIMPTDIVIKILLKKQRISSPAEYVVNKWPETSVFSKQGWHSAMVSPERNFRSGAEFMSRERAVSAVANFQAQFESEILSYLEADDRPHAQSALDAYVDRFNQKLADDDGDFHTEYLMNSWSIVMARDLEFFDHEFRKNSDASLIALS
ncbi:class I SAM-dependent methyltransferase [Ruegeria lacuscaerulensis]|uniref:class I SAM-dependent methyltransferase n=1 Tax=Ruegeria lacuscaerulensis TaxID=55218 RepID=UPI00147B6464|nr:class I SAM-dependent methyltransferase [Ruegeria lacuscaerulensis]